MAIFRYLWGRGIVPEVLIEHAESPVARRLQINIVFTDLPTTEIALKRAIELAVDLAAEIRVIVPHVVPYPLPLECAAVPLEFTCRQLATFAGSAGPDPYIHVYLCRDVIELLVKLLPAPSIVVLGAKKRWVFPAKPARIARTLRKRGCAVVLV